MTLIGIVTLGVMATNFFMVGEPVYILGRLHGTTWLPGTLLALNKLVLSLGGTAAVHLTRRFARTSTMAAGTVLFVLWSVVSLTAALIPGPWLTVWLLGTIATFIVGSLLFMSRANALAEAIAPPAHRGRYLAMFQYAFTVAQILAPAAVALFAAGVWAPWLLVAVCAGLATYGLVWIRPRLPAHATGPVEPRQVPANT